MRVWSSSNCTNTVVTNVLPNAPDNYALLCNIVTDLSHLPLTSIKNATGKKIFRVVIDIVLLFGLTELKAQIAWKESVSARKFSRCQALLIE